MFFIQALHAEIVSPSFCLERALADTFQMAPSHLYFTSSPNSFETHTYVYSSRLHGMGEHSSQTLLHWRPL